MWVAVDVDGTENIFSCKPKRHHNGIRWAWSTCGKGTKRELPIGTIFSVYEINMSWEDMPIQVKR